MERKINWLARIVFTVAVIAAPIFHAHAEPGAIDPVLLKQIQESLEADWKEAYAALAQKRTELLSIAAPKERKEKEERLNELQKEFQKKFTDIQAKIEKDFVPSEPRSIDSASSTTPSPTPQKALGSTVLAGFDLSLTGNAFTSAYADRLKCHDVVFSKDGSDAKIEATECEILPMKDEKPSGQIMMYRGKVYQLWTYIPEGVKSRDLLPDFTSKVGGNVKFHDISRYDYCMASGRILGGSAFLFSGYSFNKEIERNVFGTDFISGMNQQNLFTQVLPEPSDKTCQQTLTTKDVPAWYIFFFDMNIRDSITTDLNGRKKEIEEKNKNNFRI